MTQAQVCFNFARGHHGAAGALATREAPGREDVLLLYSYATPVAVRTRTTVFASTERHSATTARHLARLRDAAHPTTWMPPERFAQVLDTYGVRERGRAA